jgi:hypothetical protein
MECEKLVINGHEYIRSDCMIAATGKQTGTKLKMLSK